MQRRFLIIKFYQNVTSYNFKLFFILLNVLPFSLHSARQSWFCPSGHYVYIASINNPRKRQPRVRNFLEREKKLRGISHHFTSIISEEESSLHRHFINCGPAWRSAVHCLVRGDLFTFHRTGFVDRKLSSIMLESDMKKISVLHVSSLPKLCPEMVYSSLIGSFSCIYDSRDLVGQVQIY